MRSRSIVLDAEALSALASGERRMQAWATVARRTDSTLYASTATLAEVTDGTSRDAEVRRVAKAIRLEAVTEDIGYRAGKLRFSAATTRPKPRDLTVDALVAATATTLPSPVVVLTADPPDLTRLLVDTTVQVETIT